MRRSEADKMLDAWSTAFGLLLWAIENPETLKGMLEDERRRHQAYLDALMGPQ